MVRNTRSLVQMDLPPRYAQTLLAVPDDDERALHALLSSYLRDSATRTSDKSDDEETAAGEGLEEDAAEGGAPRRLNRMQLGRLLAAHGSHPSALTASLSPAAAFDATAAEIVRLAGRIERSAKDQKLLELVGHSREHKALVFANFPRTIHQLQAMFDRHAIECSVFSGEQSEREKDAAVAALRDRVPVMLCTDLGGEGRNLQFADTVINYDLPWNPMKIEQRVGRVHRIGQTRDVFVFNLCTAGSLEARILRLLTEKIRMFELVVGEVGSILGNLDGGEEFESLVLNLWMRARDEAELDQSFESLGDSLLAAQERYVEAKELDSALFGEDYE
jgi:SNF2 family DNA or RNA helicase